MHVSFIPIEHVASLWPRVEPFMEKAASYTYGRYTADDILDSIQQYDYHLWVAFEDAHNVHGAVVTRFIQYPRKKYLDLTFIGGEKALTWKEPMLKILQHWAYDNECDGIESSGRPGWARALRGDGYKMLWQTYELPVADCGLGG
jgi:hypothetical protein